MWSHFRISIIVFIAIFIVPLSGTCLESKALLPSQLSTATSGTASDDKNPSLDEASLILKVYCGLETDRQYEKLYSLLSAHRKKYLETFKVRNAKEYSNLRDGSEARWYGFVIDRVAISASETVKAFGHATIEESGESHSVSFSARLIKENGAWKVDDWKY